MEMALGRVPNVKTALRWTVDGKGRHGRPKETWRRTVEKEMTEYGLTWNTNGLQTDSLVDVLCATGHEEEYVSM